MKEMRVTGSEMSTRWNNEARLLTVEEIELRPLAKLSIGLFRLVPQSFE